jgi:hypothetical protein
MCGAISPLPNAPSWRGTQLKHRENFTFTLPLYLPLHLKCNYYVAFIKFGSKRFKRNIMFHNDTIL